MRWLLLLTLLPLLSSAPCKSVDRDHLLASDLAAEVGSFSQLDASLVIAPAPVPGTQRTFSVRELNALASKYAIPLDGPALEVCFERALHTLTADEIRAAMQRTIGPGDIRIDIVDYSRQRVPSGELAFARAGLTYPRAGPADAPAFWRGTLKYTSRNTLAVWATVRLRQQVSAVISVRAVRSGAAIDPADVTLTSRELFPFTPHFAELSQTIGRVARKPIPAGALISDELIEAAPDVQAGDTVTVVVTNGSARISFDAVARSQGRKGDRILLVNPESHRTFRALLDGKGQAHIGGGA